MSAKSPLRTRRQLHRDHTSLPSKSERTQHAIFDAAVEFLWSHPFRDLTVAELMSLAGASRPAFYQYFTDLPLAKAANPDKMEFINVSGKAMDTVLPNDYSAFEKLHAVLIEEMSLSRASSL